MGRDFKSFKGNPKCKKNVEDVLRQYDGKSEGELMGEIMTKYSEGVKNGTVSKEELDKFFNNAKAYLTKEQLNKMQTIINTLKNN